MAGISQHIPNYIKGISRQPDELKQPGQVRDAKNCIPDVTNGLMKRPGSRLLNPLGFGKDGDIHPDDPDGVPGSAKDGKWFNLYVDKDESYIGQINKDGRVEMWSTFDGMAQIVKYSPVAQDFSSPEDGVTASPSCDSEAFAAARDAYRALDAQVSEKEIEIDVNQTALNESLTDNNDGVMARYSTETVEGYTVYVIDSGYVEKVDGGEVGQVQPPENANGKAGKREGNVVCMTRPAYYSYLQKREQLDREREEQDDENNGWWDDTIPGDQYELLFDGEDCNIYDYRTDNSSGVTPNKTQEEINRDKEDLTVMKSDRTDALMKFAGEASSCGNTIIPNDQYFRTARSNDAAQNVLPYFQFAFPGDIQTLSVQERVLVVNRTVPITMSKEIATVRYPEGYVEIKGVAGARTYSFRVDVKDVEAGFTKMRATKLNIAKAPKRSDGDDGCKYAFTEVFENITQGQGKNLVFELNTRSESLPVDRDRPDKGYYCKYFSDVKLKNGGEGWKKGDMIEVEMAGFTYQIEVTETIEEDIAEEFEISSNVTASDGSVEITVKMILDDLLGKFNSDGALTALGFKAKIIGNGIYIWNEKGEQFGLVTNEWDVMNTFGNFITDVGQLPTQCKAGFITRVSNSAADEDDYYLQFYGADGKPVSEGDITPQGKLPNTDMENYPRKNFGSDGPGAWYECAKPGLPHIINHDSMPHQIRKVKGIFGTEFLVQPVNWADREVGDDVTNPIPRFVGLPKRTRFRNGNLGAPRVEPRYINNAMFYRNRLCFLTGEAVVMSQPIENIEFERFNFWKSTATTLLDTDPIDILVTSKMPSTLYDAIIVNSGLLLFSPNVQFLLSTNQDILSPKTAEVNEISSYRFNEKTEPISMGTTVAFMSDAGKNGRLFEMTNIGRDQQPEVLEQTKIIADLIPENLDQITHSKENGIVIAGKFQDRELWVYRYFNDGVERKQAAWVRWELTGNLVYMTIINDVLFTIVSNIFDNVKTEGWDVVTMQRIDLKETVWSAIVEDYNFRGGEREGKYQAHLDNYRVAWPTDMQYYKHLNQTYFELPLGYFSDKRLVGYTLKYGKYQGRAIYPIVEIKNNRTLCILDGNWSDTRLMIGYEYEYLVEFPTIYPTQSAGNITKADTNCNLIVHRVNLSLGQNGVYETTLKRRGHHEPYIQMYEARHEDEYVADDVAFDTAYNQTVPIYERNTNFSPNPYGFYLSSNHPSPCTLISMSWEGEYTNKNYKRV